MSGDSLYIDRPTARTVRAIAGRLTETNPGRAALVDLFDGLHRAVTGIVGLARRLDERLYPDHESVECSKPVLIVAAPRSGTTFLHRLMALSDRFFCLRLYHTIFPAISLFRLFDAAANLDELLGGLLAEGLEELEERLFGGWSGIHRLGFDRPEEDEGLFALTLLSPGLYLLFPEIDELSRPYILDDLEPATRRRVLDFYESSLTRVKFHEGRSRRLLSKSVLAPGRLHSLLERFPEARIVHLVRHPYRSVPSFVSMFRRPWSVHSPEIADDSPQCRRLADLVIDYYRRMQEAERELDNDRMRTVRFRELVSHPRDTIEEIFSWLEMEWTPAYERALNAELDAERGDSSSHDYSLEQFGLTRGEIYTRLRGVFEDYGFEP